MSSIDYFWKAFEATGSPELYMLYKKSQNKTKFNDDDGFQENVNL
ncbi:MAG: hypothetical protein ACOX7U_06795 [Desulfitobacteriia bacterium]|jgi:hypothetical protein